MNQNVCEKHFPEPIIYISETGEPLCKKCIPCYMEEMRKKAKAARSNNKDDGLDEKTRQ